MKSIFLQLKDREIGKPMELKRNLETLLFYHTQALKDIKNPALNIDRAIVRKQQQKLMKIAGFVKGGYNSVKSYGELVTKMTAARDTIGQVQQIIEDAGG